MTSTPAPSIRPKKTLAEADLLAPAVVVSIIIAIFAVVTQVLSATGAAFLSTTQMLTAWLVAIGFIVLLWIAYMISRAYVKAGQAHTAPTETNNPNLEEKTMFDRKDNLKPQPPVPVPPVSNSQLPWIPPEKFRYLNGRPHPVSTEAVFPDGCRLEPGEISEAPVPALDGEQAAQCWVVDLSTEPYLKDRAHDTVVNIIPASNKPDVKGWPRFALVEFEGLEVIPYETDQDVAHGQMEYVLRAKGVRLVT